MRNIIEVIDKILEITPQNEKKFRSRVESIRSLLNLESELAVEDKPNTINPITNK